MTPRQEVEASRKEVVRLLKLAAERCIALILNPPGNTASAQTFNASRAAQQLASLNRELEQLGARAVSVAAKGVAAAYRQGIAEAERQVAEALDLSPTAIAQEASAGLVGGFNVVDSSRARILIEQTVADVHKAVISMRETTGKIVRQCQALGLDNRQVNQLLATGTIEGKPRETLRQLRALIQKSAIDGQIVTVNTRTGVVMQFKPDDYADLVMQTKTAETTTAALMERLQRRGINYVKVIGSNSANYCSTFLGKVFYIGPGEDPTGRYPSVRVLPRGGPPFHPRCTKRFVAFVIALKSDKEIQGGMLGAHQREFLGLDDRAAGKLFRQRRREAS